MNQLIEEAVDLYDHVFADLFGYNAIWDSESHRWIYPDSMRRVQRRFQNFAKVAPVIPYAVGTAAYYAYQNYHGKRKQTNLGDHGYKSKKRRRNYHTVEPQPVQAPPNEPGISQTRPPSPVAGGRRNSGMQSIKKMPPYMRRRIPRRRKKRYGRKKRVSKRLYRAIASIAKPKSVVQNFRTYAGGILTGTINTKTGNAIGCFTRSVLDSKFDATLPTLTSAAALDFKSLQSANGYLKVVGGYVAFEFANNYAKTVNLDLYTFKCLEDTNTAALTELDSLFDDYTRDTTNAVYATAQNHIMYSYMDIMKGMKQWKLLKRWKIRLEPTERKTFYMPLRYAKLGQKLDHYYNTSGTYAKNLSLQFVIQQWGVLGHNVAQTGAQYGDSKVDYQLKCDMRYKIFGSEEVRSSELAVVTSNTDHEQMTREILMEVDVQGTNAP